MAFQQPQPRPQAARQLSFSLPAAPVEHVVQTSPHKKRALDESQEWILFAPDSQASCTSQTPRTANLSRWSEFGSLETGARSDQRDDQRRHNEADDDDNDDDDVDSLDDGLHAFQSPPSAHLDQSGGTVLPMHDGLGTFATSYAYADNEDMQEQLWQFERFNPHRRRRSRRRSSVQRRLEAREGEEDEADVHTLDPHEERRLRIEQWRVEQSKAVLDEIERESRRRQRRVSRLSGGESTLAEPMTIGAHPATTTSSPPESKDCAESQSFWQRITRRVIRELIGLDETTLAVIFGEDLPADLSPTPTQTSPLADRVAESAAESQLAPFPGRKWERRLLERIARELGILVNQISDQEGAFSTYSFKVTEDVALEREHTPSQPLQSSGPAVSALSTAAQVARRRGRLSSDATATSDPMFMPTLAQPPYTGTDASLWGIEEEPNSSRPFQTSASADRTKKEEPAQHDPAYWESDLDIRMIFTYLRDRFSSRPSSPTPAEGQDRLQPEHLGPLPATWATTSARANTASALGTSPESLRRADLIRRHHPLVSRAAERRRESLLRRHHTAMVYRQRAASSSCASQSAKRSRVSSGSRRYWDLGGSGAAGSVVSVASVGSGGLMGSWGEA